MPLSEWLTGRLAGQLESHLLVGGLARRGIFREAALDAADRRASQRPSQARGPAVGAADPGALVSSLRTGLAHGGMTLNIVHTESSTGWGGQELRILTEMEGMARRGHRAASASRHPTRRSLPPRGRVDLSVDTLPIEWKTAAGACCDASVARASSRGISTSSMRTARRTHGSQQSRVRRCRAPPARAHAPPVHARQPARDDSLAVPARNVAHRSHRRGTEDAGWCVTTAMIRRRITSVRTGIDLARFRPRDRDEARAQCGVDARPAVGIVATLRDWKGHDYLLDAWRELKTRVPGWQLLVIGDGPRRAHLERRVARAGYRC